jgi:3-oxoacyl-(acyl-carrier-protein) synthase
MIRESIYSLLDQAGCSSFSEIDAIVIGINSTSMNDMIYLQVLEQIFKRKILTVQYKHIFGQSFSASALGTYAASVCLHKQLIPAHMLPRRKESLKRAKRLLLYNHYQNISHSLILLSRC